ncbi:DUF4333 domain-containing protein [Kitasatospora phosalacinea]|uniref:DUF4333 domain-containing protein n=1 Tax=Kitasatospora phosalacinea TaxID=2065 RepID=A0A9W6PL89_9ACTN|nr:DUF4333 domain-containing protein [Kitasatospora phosalacinea]GLW56927.1 hypothetical protein Kpho01_49380 [Kitasatospora phosalacinea]
MFAVRSAKTVAIAVAAAATALLAGCTAEVHVGTTTSTQSSGSTGSTGSSGDDAAAGDAALPKVSADKVGKLAAQRLAQVTKQPEPEVVCPDDLLGKVGTVMRCQLTADDGSTLGVTVTVTSVSGKNVNFDIKADERGTPKPSATS